VQADSVYTDSFCVVHVQGMGEIRAAADRLEALPQFRAGNMWVLPLHSTVSPADQRKVLTHQSTSCSLQGHDI